MPDSDPAIDAPIDSEALRVNLARTAHVADIPARWQPLIDACRAPGARRDVELALGEYHHPYRNVDDVVTALRDVALKRWPELARDDGRAERASLLAELLAGVLDDPATRPETRTRLVGLIAGWCRALVARHQEHGALLVDLAARLAADLPAHPRAYVARDAELRAWLRAAADRGAPAPTALVRGALREGYALIADHLDVVAWARAAPAQILRDRDAVIDAFEGLDAAAMRAWAARVDSDAGDDGAEDTAAALLALPGPRELLRRIEDAVHRIDEPADRVSACLFLLRDEELGRQLPDVDRALTRAIDALLDQRADDDDPTADDDTALQLLDRLRAFFADRAERDPRVRFDIYRRVGRHIGQRRAFRAANRLIEDLLSQPFEYPDIPPDAGATDEWHTRVNPHHLDNIRCWLAIVESAPLLFERLAAALHVQLILGGVFVADTDLFQRDVSHLLAADLRGCYFVAKQLLRAFPVYFNDVGAEGDLRTVSTVVDELCERRDALVHFLRKQVHAESSSRLIGFTADVLRYWADPDADPSPLARYLPQHVYAQLRTAGQRRYTDGPRAVLGALDASVEDLLALRAEELAAALGVTPGPIDASARQDDPEARDRKRIEQLVRLHQLLEEKYRTDRDDVAALVQPLPIDPWLRNEFLEHHSEWKRALSQTATDRDRRRAARERLLDKSLQLLVSIRNIILDRRATETDERIFHKRHVAAGIPSMYGNYREPRFDALRVGLRVEALVITLLDDLQQETEEEHARYVNRAVLRRIAIDLRRYEEAMKVDLLASEPLSANLKLLEKSFDRGAFSFQQYQNVFAFLAGDIADLISHALRVYDEVTRRILEADARPTDARPRLGPDGVAEVVLREVLTGALGLQQIDNLVTSAMRRLGSLLQRMPADALTRMMHYDPASLVSWIDEPDQRMDDQLTLGSKALSVKSLAAQGLRVPEGFVLTTQLYGVLPAFPKHKSLYRDTRDRIVAAVRRLERRTGRLLGDPDRLLTLSVRSGAAISMPGLMTTFVNIGLHKTLVERMAADPVKAWLAWDSYRRLYQSWAMSEGVPRDAFDQLMADGKRRFGAPHKHELTSEQMRELALEYRELARSHVKPMPSDPMLQVTHAVRRVLASWDAPSARVYRDHLGLAPDWGTAVIVQRMVYGNRSPQSGSGVVFTCNPKEPPTRLVQLFGDYTVQSQGEDLVGGLVYPMPISEAQRRSSPTYAGVESSLERDFPRIYQRLLEAGRMLVEGRESGTPQEIEFTFESPDPDELYLLQKRPVVLERAGHVQLDPAALPDGPPQAYGMGVAGAAYTGRVAFDMEQITRLLTEDPEAHVLLLRPDTVPEDIAMILRVGGILTARGGSTSHAAVTAKRLGKTAIVDCRTLVVDDARNLARLAGAPLRHGDRLTVDGRSGRIWIG